MPRAATVPPRSPGKTTRMLEPSRAAQGIRAQVPLLTVTGARPGPCAVIVAGQHGRELNGIAAIAEVFATLDPQALRGEVRFLPVLNPVAIRGHVQDYPTEAGRYRPLRSSQNMNLNRAWSPAAWCAETYVATIAELVAPYLRQADFGLDLHGWTGLSLSLAWAHRRDLAFLRAFGLPWLLVKDHDGHAGLTEDFAGERHLPWITCELTPQNRVDPATVAFGVRGILNALRFHRMLAGPPQRPPVQYEFAEDHVETVIQTPVGGLLVGLRAPGDWVRQGEPVLRVLSLETLDPVFTFTAPHDALVFNVGGTPWGEDLPESFVVYPGQLVGLLKQPARILHPRGHRA